MNGIVREHLTSSRSLQTPQSSNRINDRELKFGPLVRGSILQGSLESHNEVERWLGPDGDSSGVNSENLIP